MRLGEIIAKYRKDHNDMSQRQFAARCNGVSNGYISMIENNCNPCTGKPIVPSLDKLKAIAEAMEISLHELLDMADDMPVDISNNLDIITVPTLSMIPIIGVVRAGPGGLALEEPLGHEPAAIDNHSEDYFYLKVVGDSMIPSINENDLALVHIQPDAESGDLVVAIIDGEEGTIKKLIKKPGALVLQAFNSAYPPRVFTGEEMNSVRIVGKVIRTVRIW